MTDDSGSTATAPLDLDTLRDITLLATGRNWKWNDYRIPDLMATVGDPDFYEYETEVIEATHDGGCGCRRECHLELNITPQDAEFIAATGPDVVLALIQRIRDLEAAQAAAGSTPNTGAKHDRKAGA